jgi:hypothetical protein
MKLNFWESFGLSTAISALDALVGGNSSLNADQKADITNAMLAVQKVQSDFSDY